MTQIDEFVNLLTAATVTSNEMSHFPHHHRRKTDDPQPEPPIPLTEDQLEWITKQNERIARRVLWLYVRWAMVGFVVLFVAFLGNVIYSNHLNAVSREQVVRSGDIVAVAGCNRDFQERLEIRGVLIESKAFTRQAYRRGAISEVERDLRIEFYNERLQGLPLPDCRVADEILTDDPDKPLREPAPLYPQSTEQIVPPVSSEGGG